MVGGSAWGQYGWMCLCIEHKIRPPGNNYSILHHGFFSFPSDLTFPFINNPIGGGSTLPSTMKMCSRNSSVLKKILFFTTLGFDISGSMAILCITLYVMYQSVHACLCYP